MEIIGLEGPGNDSASIWSYNFSICLQENLKLIISMISGFLDVSLSPTTNYFYLLNPQRASNNSRNSLSKMSEFIPETPVTFSNALGCL